MTSPALATQSTFVTTTSAVTLPTDFITIAGRQFFVAGQIAELLKMHVGTVHERCNEPGNDFIPWIYAPGLRSKKKLFESSEVTRWLQRQP